MRFLGWILRRLLVAACLCSAAHATGGQDAGRPWFAFAGRDAAALDVVNRYFRRGDFLNVNSARNRPELRTRIGHARIFRLSPSLRDVSAWASRPCEVPDSAGLILYDIEGWEATPAAEKGDVSASIEKASTIVRGVRCREFGIAPAREYLTGDPRQCSIGVGSVPAAVQWRHVKVFVIQAQGLLRKNCVRTGGIEAYTRLVAEQAAIARAGRADVVVLAEVSFNRSAPDVIVRAIQATQGVVDGFYLAYPHGPNCPYCSPADLEYVLSQFRPPLPR
jgi:hypothetical protein